MSKKISQLPSAGALDGSELVEAVQAGINVQTTSQAIANLGGGSQNLDDVLTVGNDAGAVQIKNIADATDPQDATSLAQVTAAITAQLEGLKWKSPAKIATTANITLSGLQTIDGALTIANDRVLVKNQSDQTENGIYLSAVGAWTRTSDANTADELEGATISVEEGTSNANTTWIQTADNITLGSTSIAWSQLGTSVPDASETVKGIIEIATQAETNTGTDDVRALTPLKFNTKLRATRTVTGADSIIQTDDNSLIIFNSATPFNFTVDQLTASSKLSYVNIGAGAVTLVAGSGVTITGRTVIPGAIDTDYPGGVIFWISATAVRTITGPAKEPELVASSVSAGTMTLDMASLYQRKFEDTTLQTGDFTIAFSNTTNAQVFTLSLRVNGTIAITVPSSVVTEEGDTRFVNGTKILTLIASTKRYLLSFNRLASGVFQLAATDSMYDS